MILCDSSVIADYREYGIMLPIAGDRGKQVLKFLSENNACGSYQIMDFSSAKKFLRLNTSDNYFLNRDDLERIHSRDFTCRLYGDGINKAILETFELFDAQGRPNRYEPDRAVRPLSDLFKILLAQAGGTYLACLLALSDKSVNKRGFCYYLGGGMHHARYDAPSGFCLINDVTACAFKLLAEKRAGLIWIIDMDAHKGDGTAELVHFARKRGELMLPGGKSPQSEKPCILTLSIHMAKGWPLDEENLALAEEGRAPLIPSDADIGIDSGEEGEYTVRLADGIKILEKLSGKNPDFVIVVDGADPYEHDGLTSSGLLRLTLEQCIERDVFVYRCLHNRGIPSAWIQSGGYGDRAWEPPAHFLNSISM